MVQLVRQCSVFRWKNKRCQHFQALKISFGFMKPFAKSLGQRSTHAGTAQRADFVHSARPPYWPVSEMVSSKEKEK